MFEDKKRAYSNKAPFMCSAVEQAHVLTHKQKTMLETLAMDKHSSLLQKIVNYGCKKFHNIGPWFKIFTGKARYRFG
jgi:hypothetical protein